MLLIHEDYAWDPHSILNITIKRDDDVFVLAGTDVIMTTNETYLHACDLHILFLSIFAS